MVVNLHSKGKQSIAWVQIGCGGESMKFAKSKVNILYLSLR